jgi:hypothetical protein
LVSRLISIWLSWLRICSSKMAFRADERPHW